jgi:hypothetical protein
MLPPVMLFCAGVWISSGLPCIRIYIADYLHARCILVPDCPECHYCVSRDVSVCHWANVIVRLSPSVQKVGSPTLPQGCWSDAGVVWNSADWIASIFVRTSRVVSSVTWYEVAFLNNACKSPFPRACFWRHKWERDWSEPFSTSVFVALQRVWIANPRFPVQLQVWNRVLRGSCPSSVTAQDIKEEREA